MIPDDAIMGEGPQRIKPDARRADGPRRIGGGPGDHVASSLPRLKLQAPYQGPYCG
jgi:hypothetical protein